MSYQAYKTKLTPQCPVAIKLGQVEVHAPEHTNWGIVTCDKCPDKFLIGPNRIYGARTKDVDAVKQLEELLAADHKAGRKHENSYKLPD